MFGHGAIRSAGLTCLLAVLAAASPAAAQPLDFTGVNLAGAEFGDDQLPGVFGVDYTYPTPDEVDYYVEKGMNIFRLQFRWERIQPNLGTPLDTTELTRLEEIVDYATGAGAYVILDPHNYARYHGDLIGSAQVPHAAFANFWIRLALRFGSNPRVIFGLMTEPHTIPTEQWVQAANEAIAAIRSIGGQNLILVPGNGWSAASRWFSSEYGTPNATAMHAIDDPLDNFAFEVHQYLDPDSSGTSPTVVSPTIGSQRLFNFTDWLRDFGYKGFLGEFAVAAQTIGTSSGQIGDEAIENMLDFVESNDDVWLGWSWWAGGPWWGTYMFTLEPQQLGQPGETDRPQLAVLEPYLLPEPVWAGPPALALLGAARPAAGARPGGGLTN